MWLKRVLCVLEKSLLTISNWQQLTALQLQTKEEVNRGRMGGGGYQWVCTILGRYVQDRNKRKNNKKKKRLRGKDRQTDQRYQGGREKALNGG